jgi:hypothetical protein
MGKTPFALVSGGVLCILLGGGRLEFGHQFSGYPRPRSFTSMPWALAHSRTSVVFRVFADPLLPLRAAFSLARTPARAGALLPRGVRRKPASHGWPRRICGEVSRWPVAPRHQAPGPGAAIG